MNYIIMILIIIGLAAVDFVTGWAKAYVKNSVSSSRMRKGGVNKLCEILVMCTACGLDIGIEFLGAYYQASELAGITGAIAAIAIFGYITVMELVSILENYAAINPDAAWAARIIKKLQNFNKEDKQ